MTPPSFDLPPQTRNPDGEIRSAGFELEFAGPAIEEVAGLVRELYGGEARAQNPYRWEVRTADLGSFKIELDWALLSDPDERRRLRAMVDDEETEALVERAEALIASLARRVVPLEVVTPPIPLNRLEELERLREGLRELSSEGTDSSLVYAFGLHLNPEAPALDAPSILAHLRAFLLLQDWLVERHEVDFTRRLTPYVNPFEKDFAEHVLRDGYAPSIGELIDDYLAHNPTRNRPLDLLPLFAHVDATRVFARVDDQLVGARPAYHYRLPGCRVDQAEWRLAKEWNLWVTVERLAADAPRIEAMRRAYLEQAGSTLAFLKTSWSERVAEWL